MQRYNSKMPKQPKTEIALVIAFVAVNLLAPLALGELYPFTISPMFSDQPSEYCVYEVMDAQGRQLDPALFGLHLIYDGNPVGLGMGIQAAPTLHEFGAVPTLEKLTAHVQQKLAEIDTSVVDKHVTVRRHHVFSVDHQLIENVDEFRIARPDLDSQN